MSSGVSSDGLDLDLDLKPRPTANAMSFPATVMLPTDSKTPRKSEKERVVESDERTGATIRIVLENWSGKQLHDDDSGGLQLVVSDDTENARRILGAIAPKCAIETCCSLARPSTARTDLVKLVAFQEAAWDDVKETKSCPPPLAVAVDLTHCTERETDWVDDSTHLPGRLPRETWRALETVSCNGRFIHMNVVVALTSSDAQAYGGIRHFDLRHIVLCPGIRSRDFLRRVYLRWIRPDLFTTHDAFVAFYDEHTRGGSAIAYMPDAPDAPALDVATAFRRMSLTALAVPEIAASSAHAAPDLATPTAPFTNITSRSHA